MANRKTSTALTFAVVAILAVGGFTSSAHAAYSLVWSDEFNGTGLDAANWSMDVGNGCPSLCGWGNNELQYYRTQNVAVTGGNLVLTAKREPYAGYSFTSGKVHTRGKQTFLYGRVEMRAKIPTGGGMWPAFWMMPQDDAYGGWAASGEIDIMEAANATTSVGGALHYGGGWPNNTSTSDSYSLGGANFADNFHIYAVEWEPDEIRWYVDGTLFMTRTSSQWYSDGAPGNPRAPFDQDFYIILNAAVGGNYTGCTDVSCVTASFPQEYLIDYVRVYQDIPNAAPTVTITAPVSGSSLPVGNITIEATASDSDGTVAGMEFYEGTTLIGLALNPPYAMVWNSVPDGCYTITAKAIDDLGGFGTDSVDITVGTGCGQAPYHGTPFELPAKIEVEDFDLGGEGVAYHDSDIGNNGNQYRTSENVDIENCTDAGGGYNVGWLNSEEWIEYTVNVPTAGVYTLDARVASLSEGGTFRMKFDGVDKTGDITVPVTTGWQTWVTVSASVTLEAGTQVMRFDPSTGGFNVNYFDIRFDPVADVPGPKAEGYQLHPCYPNPFNPTTTISYDLPAQAVVNLTIYDVAGKQVRTLVAGRATGPGRHEAVWNGRDDTGRAAPAGVYFYRLDAGGYSETRRMALVK